MDSDIFSNFQLGKLELKNRIARSATAERGADIHGKLIGEVFEMYKALAKGGSGLIMTGHAFVRLDGRTSHAMTGAHSDDMITGLTKLVTVVHDNSEAKIFLQLNHAGRATSGELIGGEPVAPSDVPIRMTKQSLRILSSDEIEELIEMYSLAALRGLEAGFDGIQLHASHGYLISQFLSPYTNLRTDKWGGNNENRRNFILGIIDKILEEAGDCILTVKINCEDMVKGGLELEEFVETCKVLEQHGIQAIEISGGIIESASKIIRKGINSPEKEGYFLHGAKALKESGTKIPVLVVGGFRSKYICNEAIESGNADIISLCRPLITEPDLPDKWESGAAEKSRCISCNKCLLNVKSITHCVYWTEMSDTAQ